MGGFAGSPDANFTQSSMIIDYVRVYQNKTDRKADAANSRLLIYPNKASKIISINFYKH